MTCFAARVMQETAMDNPTIVVITDRNDLDGQLFGSVLAVAGPAARAAGAGRHARRSARQAGQPPSGGIVFTHHPEVHAGEDEDLFPVLSERHNIVVIADEAHRTQYGFGATLKG